MSNCHHLVKTMDEMEVKPAPHKHCRKYEDDTLGDYHKACGGFHHVKQEAQPVVRGPVNARALVHAEVLRNGQHLLTWSCGPQDGDERTHVTTVEFFPWPRRFPMTETEPLIHLTWKLLMSKVEIINDSSVMEPTRTVAQNQARGIAEVLAIQMKPFLESADDVVRAAVQFYKDPYYVVPGLGEHLWNPRYNPDGSERVPLAAPRKAPEARPKAAPKPRVDNKSTVKLTDKEREGVKEAVSSGMFSKEDVASMFKVSLAEIESALA